MAALTLQHVSKRYPGGETVLDGVDLEVADGEFLVLVGPSGCGKSTLLRIVAGLAEASEGRVLIDGECVDDKEPGERDVAMVFQNYALYPHMTVAKNLAFPLRMAGVPRADVDARVREVAGVLGLGALLARKPAQLSGGQMQRVAVGRAIVRKPRVFLFDEPLSNLDAKLRGEMRVELQRLHARLGVTTLYVTHDQAEAMTLGARIAVLDRGRVLQVGAPMDVFEHPATRFVAGFIGSPPMNQVRGCVRAGVFACGPLSVPCPVVDEGEVWLGVRSHQVGEGGDAALVARDVEALGSTTTITCALDEEGNELRITREGHRRVAPGDRIGVALAPEVLHWFDVEDGRRLEAT